MSSSANSPASRATHLELLRRLTLAHDGAQQLLSSTVIPAGKSTEDVSQSESTAPQPSCTSLATAKPMEMDHFSSEKMISTLYHQSLRCMKSLYLSSQE